MNKHILSGIVIVTFIVYALRVHTEPKEMIEEVTGVSSNTNNNTIYRDGSYTGEVTDAIYGNVEIQATIQNGRLVKIAFLQFPAHHQYSTVINQAALPQLATEAITIQNAEVDVYSGATQTSKAFKESLESALNKAL